MTNEWERDGERRDVDWMVEFGGQRNLIGVCEEKCVCNGISYVN